MQGTDLHRGEHRHHADNLVMRASNMHHQGGNDGTAASAIGTKRMLVNVMVTTGAARAGPIDLIGMRNHALP